MATATLVETWPEDGQDVTTYGTRADMAGSVAWLDVDAFRVTGLLRDDEGHDPGAVTMTAIARAVLALTRTPIDEDGIES